MLEVQPGALYISDKNIANRVTSHVLSLPSLGNRKGDRNRFCDTGYQNLRGRRGRPLSVSWHASVHWPALVTGVILLRRFLVLGLKVFFPLTIASLPLHGERTLWHCCSQPLTFPWPVIGTLRFQHNPGIPAMST